MTTSASAALTSLYTSCSANRGPSCSDSRLSDGLLAFGSGPLLAFWNPLDGSGVREALKGHRKEITSVQFTKKQHKVIISGDAVGDVRIWHESDQWDSLCSWKAHEGAIAGLCSIATSSHGDKITLFTISSDSTLKVWTWDLSNKEDSPILAQSISFGLKIATALEVTLLPDQTVCMLLTGILLALAATDSNIHLYTYSDAQTLSKVATLSGHRDWIRTFSFSSPLPRSNDLLLASGSQDYYIRLWRIGSTTSKPVLTGLEMLDDAEAEEEISTKSQHFNSIASPLIFSATSESVLLGHESWVTSLSWSTLSTTSISGAAIEEGVEFPRLLSASADRSLILWSHSNSTSLWLNETRFGELGATPGLGFFGSHWIKDRGVCCSDWGGSWHYWVREGDGPAAAWKSGLGTSGHFDQVRDLSWQNRGEWLLTTGLDQTSRLHSPWKRQHAETWHEVARPQIHGHDIYTLAIIDQEDGLSFASGAEETIVRLFDATRNFVESATSMSGVVLPNKENRPLAAVVPPLGLSNRAVSNGNGTKEEEVSLTLKLSTIGDDPCPPLEEELLSSTLWPEFEKLYGHGYEIATLASSHNGKWLASACKASTAEHATIHLRETTNWRLHAVKMPGHTLTITRIAFSPDDELVLSVGRDRSWHLHMFESVEAGYEAVASAPKAHSRIIWDACWCGSSSLFATASRDKTVKLWARLSKQADSWKMAASISLPDSVTAVASIRHRDHILLAIGTEAGDIQLFAWSANVDLDALSAENVRHLVSWPSRTCHALTVTRLAFAPQAPDENLRLASGSEDRSVRIWDVQLQL